MAREIKIPPIAEVDVSIPERMEDDPYKGLLILEYLNGPVPCFMVHNQTPKTEKDWFDVSGWRNYIDQDVQLKRIWNSPGWDVYYNSQKGMDGGIFIAFGTPSDLLASGYGPIRDHDAKPWETLMEVEHWLKNNPVIQEWLESVFIDPNVPMTFSKKDQTLIEECKKIITRGAVWEAETKGVGVTWESMLELYVRLQPILLKMTEPAGQEVEEIIERELSGYWAGDHFPSKNEVLRYTPPVEHEPEVVTKPASVQLPSSLDTVHVEQLPDVDVVIGDQELFTKAEVQELLNTINPKAFAILKRVFS